MSLSGISRRLRRLHGGRGRFLLVALDHGLPAGPIPGLEDPVATVAALDAAPVTGLILTPGIARAVPIHPSRGLVVHLSAGTLLASRPTSKVLVTGVERALSLGADAVSVQIHFGDATENRMLSDAGSVVDAAGSFGVPVLLMAYPPGAVAGTASAEAIAHAARAAAELGADLVQIPSPGTADRMRLVAGGCPVPVIVAGGPRAASPAAFLDSVREALEGGAAGVSVGRNLFQHPDPAAFAQEVGDILFGERPRIAIAEA